VVDGYDTQYRYDQQCYMAVEGEGFLTATEFSTPNADVVTIGKKNYYGTIGPQQVKVAAGDDFKWVVSDNQGVPGRNGWKICWTAN